MDIFCREILFISAQFGLGRQKKNDPRMGIWRKFGFYEKKRGLRRGGGKVGLCKKGKVVGQRLACDPCDWEVATRENLENHVTHKLRLPEDSNFVIIKLRPQSIFDLQFKFLCNFQIEI